MDSPILAVVIALIILAVTAFVVGGIQVGWF